MTTLSSWGRQQKNNGWHSSFVQWVDGHTAYISVVFSWDVAKAVRCAKSFKSLGYTVRAGGPAVALNPDGFDGIAELGGEIDALPRHNKNATFTTRGCVRKCSFCAVPKVEGAFRELSDWTPRPIVCDNNLLASSKKHFDTVIDRLKPIKGIDFNQGLDARLLTSYHASRMAELDLKFVRLAWDHVSLESKFMDSYQVLTSAGIPPKNIRVYVLIGYNDTPEDALYRLRKVWDLGSLPNPMRYQPLNVRKKNEFVGNGWSHSNLQRYVRYWANLKITQRIPFEEFYTSWM